MTSRYRFHPIARLGLLQGEGALTLDDWDKAAAQIMNWPAHGGIRRILSDRRRMVGDFPAWMEDQVIGFIRERAQALGQVQWAVVLPENAWSLEVVRHAALSARGTRVSIKPFTDIKEAIRWLLGVYEDEQVTALIRWVDQGA